MKNTILLFLLFTLISCSKSGPVAVPAEIELTMLTTTLATRSQDPDEELLSDLNYFVFNSDLSIEETGYLNRRSFKSNSTVNISLVKGLEYTICACVNFGYDISDISSFEELQAYRFYLNYPDEYSTGLPMVGVWTGVVSVDMDSISIELKRLMAKISLSIDRSGLDSDVTLAVRSIEICNCPKSVLLLEDSAARGSSDIFSSGFSKTYEETDDINLEDAYGVSNEVSVFMLENMQGELLPDNSSYSTKILDDSDSAYSISSYIEIKAEYNSDSFTSYASPSLIYRFYLGDSPSNFDVERNCHYHYTLCPQGSGLEEESWRVDKCSLSEL